MFDKLFYESFVVKLILGICAHIKKIWKEQAGNSAIINFLFKKQ